FSSAFDPTTYTGQNIIVFGVRDNNAAVPYGAPDTPSGVPASWQNAWQRAPFPFEANIDVLAKANVLIANNRLNDLSQSGQDDSFDQPGYLYKNTNNAITAASGGLGQGRFDYANIYGISLNGTYLFSRGDTTFPNGWYATNDPNDTSHPYRPYLFASGNVIRDNWIFHDEGQAIEASGSGLTITGNIIRDIPTANKDMYINNSGQKAPSGSTFSTRGILMGGQDIDVENNDIQAYQWLINGGPYTTNDAENLLWDNTTTLVNGWTVKNNTLTGLVSNFYDQDINNVTISNNTWVSGGGNSIWETADTSSTQFYALNNVHVENNTNVIGTVIMEGHAGGSNNSFIGNSAASSGTAFNYTTASSISIDGNNNFSLNPEN
ncbi:MAG TPA: hypothetical protein VKX46_03010, partial [Ktedonobacteraceae bacterium]|nr:hypothetical protein [Ktedonobacteraceae bacterium]